MTELISTMPYSPATITDGVTLIDADEIVVVTIEAFPTPASGELGAAVLCTDPNFASADPADYETVTYTGRDVGASKLTGVVREVEGTAKEWPNGTSIAAFMTAEHIKRINAAHTAHKSEEATQAELGHVKVDNDTIVANNGVISATSVAVERVWGAM